MKTLLNRVAIVTGAGTGIGFGIAQVLGSRGAKIVIAELNEVAGKQAATELSSNNVDALFVQTDVSETNSVDNMVQEVISTYTQIDILVNNAGITSRQSFSELSPENWSHVLAVNLSGMMHCARACYSHMLKSDHAAIVNIASVHANRTHRGLGIYPASKAGVVGLTRSLALDLAPDVRVNAIAPGVILTPKWVSDMHDLDAAIADRLGYIPRKRIGTLEDVGKAAAFLVSDDADYITGVVLRVDGGMLSQLYAET